MRPAVFRQGSLDGHCACDCSERYVEGDEEAVAGVVDLTAVGREQRAKGLVVPGEELLPGVVADRSTRSVDLTMSVNMKARRTRSGISEGPASSPTSLPAASAAGTAPRRSNVSRAVRASMSAASVSPSAAWALASWTRSAATSSGAWISCHA